ncbi:MAG: metal dependent hydrolase [Nitrospirae bacterium]|nr:metal dependent hydrolase [Nitrospirota bacterium]
MAGGKEVTSVSIVKDIHWLGHDTFKVVGEKLIYTDPFKIKKKDTADIILITHEHFDHCSPDDVKNYPVKLKSSNQVRGLLLKALKSKRYHPITQTKNFIQRQITGLGIFSP